MAPQSHVEFLYDYNDIKTLFDLSGEGFRGVTPLPWSMTTPHW